MRGAGLSIAPWGTLLVTGLQLDFLLLIALWACPFIHFSIYLTVYSCQLLVSEALTGDGVENPPGIQAYNNHCSPLVYQASSFIMRGYQGSQT